MRILFDTSVLIAALLERHSAHRECVTQLQRISRKQEIGLISTRSLAEVYSTITRIPHQPRISPYQAKEPVHRNLLDNFEIISLSVKDYEEVIDHLASLSLIGGVIYDALIARAAIIGHADQIMSLNERDFRTVYPELNIPILIPTSA